MAGKYYNRSNTSETMEIIIDCKLADLCMKCYQDLGWNILSSNQVLRTQKIRLERSKQIKNRTELCKLQRTFEDAMIRLESFERIPDFVTKSHIPSQLLTNLKLSRIQKKKSELYDVIYQTSEQAKQLLM
jgi:hypothetical protein